ncbi:N-acylethanolamine-hydrolyzing acid amidase-like [Hyperolius riggenbachi]|uniref:N-acylethanolamine-hydrolyzing acid amidase-like n=1 Tax=Hyperolius riggenbachi TaxID=752182 RepID=UPI0035A2C7ED
MHDMNCLCLLLVLGFFPFSSTSTLEEKDNAAPRYNISLDLPPEERWEPILQHYNITELRSLMEGLFRLVREQWQKSLYFLMADLYLDLIAQEPYAGEMRGIAKVFGLKTSEVVLINIFYETVMACTSIITEDEEGHIYHARNMDLFFGIDLKDVTLVIDFIRNGQIVYSGTTFLGFVGLYTGQSPYKFTISANAREDNQHLWKNVFSLLVHRYPVSWLIRNTLNQAQDYESAVAKLSDTPITAEMYIAVAGTKSGEGVVITRDRDGVADILHLNVSEGRWFLLQTNYDRGTVTLHDRRMDIAARALNSTGQENINRDALYKVLSIYQVLNWGTIHTTLMSASSPQDYVSYLRVYKGSPTRFRLPGQS